MATLGAGKCLNVHGGPLSTVFDWHSSYIALQKWQQCTVRLKRLSIFGVQLASRRTHLHLRSALKAWSAHVGVIMTT